jgi:hypothetical protein
MSPDHDVVYFSEFFAAHTGDVTAQSKRRQNVFVLMRGNTLQ